jgi:transposase-like protein
MKTQLSKPARSRASYTEEYKQQALELWHAGGRNAAKVAAELGIAPEARALSLSGARMPRLQRARPLSAVIRLHVTTARQADRRYGHHNLD